MKELSENEALYRVAALCSSSEHCDAEIKDKLIKWQLSDEAQARIMQRLHSEKYIDEARYSRFFVNDKLRYNQWGRIKIRQALRMKGISSDLIEDAFQNIDDNEYAEILQALIKSKKRSVKGKNSYEIKCKLIKYAMGRGFEYEWIQRYTGDVDDESLATDY